VNVAYSAELNPMMIARSTCSPSRYRTRRFSPTAVLVIALKISSPLNVSAKK